MLSVADDFFIPREKKASLFLRKVSSSRSPLKFLPLEGGCCTSATGVGLGRTGTELATEK